MVHVYLTAANAMTQNPRLQGVALGAGGCEAKTTSFPQVFFSCLGPPFPFAYLPSSIRFFSFLRFSHFLVSGFPGRSVTLVVVVVKHANVLCPFHR